MTNETSPAADGAASFGKPVSQVGGHTPGPWFVGSERGPDGETCFHSIRDADDQFVSSTWGRPHIANARLIAAAPDLLAALEAIVAFTKDDGPQVISNSALIRGRAAIAKATGA